jgi:hypothetical protein
VGVNVNFEKRPLWRWSWYTTWRLVIMLQGWLGVAEDVSICVLMQGYCAFVYRTGLSLSVSVCLQASMQWASTLRDDQASQCVPLREVSDLHSPIVLCLGWELFSLSSCFSNRYSDCNVKYSTLGFSQSACFWLFYVRRHTFHRAEMPTVWQYCGRVYGCDSTFHSQSCWL